LLLDLLTGHEEAREEAGARLRFDVEAMAARVEGAIAWLDRERATRDLPLGLFGASTGAAAALIAAAGRKGRVEAVVSRGGRPDLAGKWLAEVEAPVLLIVGSADEEVLALNQSALVELQCEKELKVVPGATHLFEEPGALDRVAEHARNWFLQHLGHAR
jgi:alpha-beta hydrolase superfamily lysophospholipase